MAMFHMANDSGLFSNEAADGLVPLYEAKMFHQFNHRWATYTDDGNIRDITDEEKSNQHFLPQPRYWVEHIKVENRLGDKWNKDWLLAFRRICRATDEHTGIFSITSKVGSGDSVFLMLPAVDDPYLVSCLCACLNSLSFDFITRQKMGGTNFNFFIIKQIPVISPEAYTSEDIKFISSRVLKLVYTRHLRKLSIVLYD